jgi:multisubunit Na+/H+ antiporter MnhG subunit
MQYENVFKVIGVVHVILAFLKLFLLLELLRRWLLVLVLGLLRWMNVYSRTHGQKQYTT